MKKCLFLFIFFSIKLSSYSQAWVWDEIEQEAKESEPITFFHIIIFAIFIALIWLGYNAYKVLKKSSREKYIKIKRLILIICLIISFLIPIGIYTYFDYKEASLRKDALSSLNTLINNADSYIEINNADYISFDEIEPRDNQLPNNQIQNDWIYKLFLENGASPYNGVFRCFNIGTFGHQVLFAGVAKNKGFSTEDNPALFHGWLRPYRIRYYSPNNINPNYDLNRVYRDFVQSFIWENNSQIRNDITKDFFHRSLNHYYELSHIESGDEMWQENKLYYENDIVQERTYEYKTIEYGNFDITYCLSRPCKLGVCEKYTEGSIFGKRLFDKIHIVKRNEALAKYCSIWVFILCGALLILYLGNPSRNKN